MAATKTVKELREHLAASGTGQAKLEAIAACKTAADAVEVLKGTFPGTHAKAVAFLAAAEAKQGPPNQ